MNENYQRKCLNATVIFVQLDNKKTVSLNPAILVFSYERDIDWAQLWLSRARHSVFIFFFQLTNKLKQSMTLTLNIFI